MDDKTQKFTKVSHWLNKLSECSVATRFAYLQSLFKLYVFLVMFLNSFEGLIDQREIAVTIFVSTLCTP